jgi:hypothetical protein
MGMGTATHPDMQRQEKRQCPCSFFAVDFAVSQFIGIFAAYNVKSVPTDIQQP